MSEFEHIVSDLGRPVNVLVETVSEHLIVDIPVFKSARGVCNGISCFVRKEQLCQTIHGVTSLTCQRNVLRCCLLDL